MCACLYRQPMGIGLVNIPVQSLTVDKSCTRATVIEFHDLDLLTSSSVPSKDGQWRTLVCVWRFCGDWCTVHTVMGLVRY